MSNSTLLFGDFLSYLRRQGFIIGVDHHLRLRELLNKLGPDCQPLQLKYILCPVFATNEKQQRQFYRAFDSYFKTLDITPVKASKVETGQIKEEKGSPEEPPAPRKWQYILLGILLAIFAVVLIYQLGEGARGVETRRTELHRPGEKEVTGTGEQSGREPTAAARSKKKVSEFDLWLKTRQDRRSFFKRYQYIFHRVGYLLPIIILLLMESYKYNRRRLILVKQRGRKPPFVWPIKVETPEPPTVKNEKFYQAARLLRQRLKSDIRRVDVPRTIVKTIDGAGFPQLRYKSLTRPPEYLFLIDRPAFRDHHAYLFDTIAKALEKEGLFVTRYFYEKDPRVCFQESDGQRVYLSDLKNRTGDHRMIIFGDCDELTDPISGDLDKWTDLFRAWRDRAILTPVPAGEWGMKEVILAKEFIVLPASLEGLKALKEHFETEAGPDLKKWIEPEAAADSQVGTSNFMAEEEKDADRLRAYLGEDVFQWLCACAVYPEIHWDLTLYLGSLPCMPEHLINEENLLCLIRLPWFRSGSMPDELRWRLIGRLDIEKSRGIRGAIIELLEKNPAPKESFAYDTYRLHLVVQRWMLTGKGRKQRKAALKSLRNTADKQLARDYTLLRFLESAPRSPLFFVLPQRLRKVFYRNGVPFFGFRTGVRVLAAVVIAAALFLILKPPDMTGMPLEVQFIAFRDINVEKNDRGYWEADYDDGIKMVYIPSGQFTMGQTDEEMKWLLDKDKKNYDIFYKNERPLHEVNLDGYWMGKTEVTVGQYMKFVNDKKSNYPEWLEVGNEYNINTGKNDYYKKLIAGDNHPIVGISWNDATAYCDWLSKKIGLKFKLPTEAQWEKAARGTDARKYPWGNEEPGKNLANYGLNVGKTSPVDSYPNGVSPCGLLNMAGNVWEWCNDWYDSDYYKNSPKKNPKGPDSGTGRVIRGGGWYLNADILRCANRNDYGPSLRIYFLGFRLSQDN